MEFFDRFDVCEAWSVWAHDWGEYGVIARLATMGFRLGRDRDAYNALTTNGQAIYDALNARSIIDPDWYAKRHTARVARAMLAEHTG